METATDSELEFRCRATAHHRYGFRGQLHRYSWDARKRVSDVQHQSGRSEVSVARVASHAEHQFSRRSGGRHSASLSRLHRNCGAGSQALSAISDADVVYGETRKEHIRRTRV